MPAEVSQSALDFLLLEAVHSADAVVHELGLDASDDLYFRVEGYGYRVGLAMAELLSRDKPRFESQLDVMKFVCKDLWIALFHKQIDNLKTNHRGTYVLIDSNFKYCQRMSVSRAQAETAVQQATRYLWFPVGLIRGVLAALGIQSDVSFECVQLPAVSFNIQT